MENTPRIPVLICILGPTASGKTKYAVKLAAELDGEIISADSRQVYRGMDIGTGKDLGEYEFIDENGNSKRIPYHLINIADAGSKYNIFQYQRDFQEVFRDICSRGKQPILCGGSGLYIEAVTRGYSLPEVPIDPKLRSELEQHDMDYLINILASMKPPHNSTDYDSKKRLIRAIEIEVYRKNNPVETSAYLPIETKFIGISVSRDDRNARIDRRLRERLREGMVEEVQRLLDSGIPLEDLIYYGLEYKFITLYLTGELRYEDMVDKLAVAIHQFAKRQMTWFRGMERRGIEIDWVTKNREIHRGEE